MSLVIRVPETKLQCKVNEMNIGDFFIIDENLYLTLEKKEQYLYVFCFNKNHTCEVMLNDAKCYPVNVDMTLAYKMKEYTVNGISQ